MAVQHEDLLRVPYRPVPRAPDLAPQPLHAAHYAQAQARHQRLRAHLKLLEAQEAQDLARLAAEDIRGYGAERRNPAIPERGPPAPGAARGPGLLGPPPVANNQDFRELRARRGRALPPRLREPGPLAAVAPPEVNPLDRPILDEVRAWPGLDQMAVAQRQLIAQRQLERAERMLRLQRERPSPEAVQARLARDDLQMLIEGQRRE